MIQNIFKIIVLIIFVVFSQSSFSADFDWDSILNSLDSLSPIIHIIFQILGALTVLGTVVDKLIPDETDGGFMSKLFAIPLLGSFLKSITKFSPFNTRE